MSEGSMAEMRVIVKEALDVALDTAQMEARPHTGNADTWMGPRSTEVSFRTEKGHEVTLTLRVRDPE